MKRFPFIGRHILVVSAGLVMAVLAGCSGAGFFGDDTGGTDGSGGWDQNPVWPYVTGEIEVGDVSYWDKTKIGILDTENIEGVKSSDDYTRAVLYDDGYTDGQTINVPIASTTSEIVGSTDSTTRDYYINVPSDGSGIIVAWYDMNDDGMVEMVNSESVNTIGNQAEINRFAELSGTLDLSSDPFYKDDAGNYDGGTYSDVRLGNIGQINDTFHDTQQKQAYYDSGYKFTGYSQELHNEANTPSAPTSGTLYSATYNRDSSGEPERTFDFYLPRNYGW